LTFKEKSESWNVLEYLEYLNLYGDFYLMEMEKRILEANSSPTSVVFESGFWEIILRIPSNQNQVKILMIK
jgi:hypothetical protein